MDQPKEFMIKVITIALCVGTRLNTAPSVDVSIGPIAVSDENTTAACVVTHGRIYKLEYLPSTGDYGA